MLPYVYIYFVDIFFVFRQKNLCFYQFNFFFFDEVSLFRQQYINQSESGISDKRLYM